MSYVFKILSVDLSLDPAERTALGLGTFPGDPRDAAVEVSAYELTSSGDARGVSTFFYAFDSTVITTTQLLDAIRDLARAAADAELTGLPFLQLLGREFPI